MAAQLKLNADWAVLSACNTIAGDKPGAEALSGLARAFFYGKPDRMRRLGMLMNRAADDPRGQVELAAFQQALQQLGWSDGRNIRIDTRWGENDVDRDRGYAAELVALAPDLILASGTLSVAALRHATRTLPIVFVEVSDPVRCRFSR
jgi:putative tryptophan/tyrosine transport system substrate-binding protein